MYAQKSDTVRTVLTKLIGMCVKLQMGTPTIEIRNGQLKSWRCPQFFHPCSWVATLDHTLPRQMYDKNQILSMDKMRA